MPRESGHRSRVATGVQSPSFNPGANSGVRRIQRPPPLLPFPSFLTIHLRVRETLQTKVFFLVCDPPAVIFSGLCTRYHDPLPRVFFSLLLLILLLSRTRNTKPLRASKASTQLRAVGIFSPIVYRSFARPLRWKKKSGGKFPRQRVARKQRERKRRETAFAAND